MAERKKFELNTTVSCKNVANYLKCIVNQMFEDGQELYKDADEKQPVSLFDLSKAISILDEQEDEILTITE